MLESSSFDLANSYDEEENQQEAYNNTSQVIEHSKRKRPLEDKDDTEVKRVSKLQEPMQKEENQPPVLLNLFPQVHESDSEHHKRDDNVTTLLIQDIGPDFSLNSLFNRPKLDYGSIGSDQLLVRSGSANHGSMASGTQHHNEEKYDSNSLIHEIGRDISINCLLHCSRSNYCSIASLNRSFRSLIRSGEIYKLRRQMGIIEHWVYLCCNLIEWEAFDVVSGKWMSLPSMNSNECFICADKESLAVGTQLLVFGKQIKSFVIYKYSLLTNSWSSGMETNISRCLFGCASLGEIAIVAGGCDLTGNILNSAELYNSETGTWEILPSMNKPRKLCAAVFMDEKFYVIGGVGRDNNHVNGGAGTSNLNNLIPITSGEVYDLKTKCWHEILDMYPSSFHGADNNTPVTSKAPPLLAVVKNELYAAFSAEKELWKYDKKKNHWNSIGKLPERVTSMHGWGIAFKASGNFLLVIGGPSSCAGGFIEINAWEPNDDSPPEWIMLGRKNLGSFVYNCAVMGC